MERKKMKKKAFTLVELLVVIAIIAMLLAILMPALGKVRQMAQRMVCSANLGGVGKALLAYSTDDPYESYPVAGPRSTKWDRGTTTAEGFCTWDWKDKDIPGSSGNVANDPKSTISACLYLLVKYADVPVGQFLCPGGDEKKFDPINYNLTVTLMDVWDFGSGKSGQTKTGYSRGRGHNSYSYHLPLPITDSGEGSLTFPIKITTNPAKAVMADRNPFWDKIRVDATGNADPRDPDLYVWDSETEKIKKSTVPFGNASAHQKDGQNVLFADGHTKFEDAANCGIENDNIYTTWGKSVLTLPAEENIRQCGGTTRPGPGAAATANCPLGEDDSFLVSDYN